MILKSYPCNRLNELKKVKIQSDIFICFRPPPLRATQMHAVINYNDGTLFCENYNSDHFSDTRKKVHAQTLNWISVALKSRSFFILLVRTLSFTIFPLTAAGFKSAADVLVPFVKIRAHRTIYPLVILSNVDHAPTSRLQLSSFLSFHPQVVEGMVWSFLTPLSYLGVFVYHL